MAHTQPYSGNNDCQRSFAHSLSDNISAIKRQRILSTCCQRTVNSLSAESAVFAARTKTCATKRCECDSSGGNVRVLSIFAYEFLYECTITEATKSSQGDGIQSQQA